MFFMTRAAVWHAQHALRGWNVTNLELNYGFLGILESLDLQHEKTILPCLFVDGRVDRFGR